MRRYAKLNPTPLPNFNPLFVSGRIASGCGKVHVPFGFVAGSERQCHGVTEMPGRMWTGLFRESQCAAVLPLIGALFPIACLLGLPFSDRLQIVGEGDFILSLAQFRLRFCHACFHRC